MSNVAMLTRAVPRESGNDPGLVAPRRRAHPVQNPPIPATDVGRPPRPPWTEGAWSEAPLRDEVRRLLSIPAGAQLAQALAQLPRGRSCAWDHARERIGPLPVPGSGSGVPCACQVVVAAAWEACSAWAAAGAADALVDAVGDHELQVPVGGGCQVLHDPGRDELAPALRHSPGAMATRIAAARALVPHPDLLELVASGATSAWAARTVVSHVVDLEAEAARRVVAEVVRRVRGRLSSGRCGYTGSDLSRIARAARLRICPEAGEQARLHALARRRVLVHPLPDGMAALVAEVAEADAHRIHRRLSSVAAAQARDAATCGRPDPRTRDQVRADLLVDVLLGADSLAGPRAPRHGDVPRRSGGTPEITDQLGTRPEIQVVVSLETLLRLRDDPAKVPGLGHIPAEVARELAADGRWRAWVIDARGAVTATGGRGYVPGAELARFVRAREPNCRFPGCRQPTARCDLDHTVAYPRGSTSAANLGPLCRRHHNLKTYGAFGLVVETAQSETGTSAGPELRGWRWRTPAGFTLRGAPEPALE